MCGYIYVCVSTEFNLYSMEIHIHHATVIQWNQILLSKLTACTKQQFSLSSRTMKEEWLLSLSTSSCSLDLPHYAQPLSGFSMCPSLQVPCILLSLYWHHCMHSFLCLSAERKQNCLLLGFPKHFIWAIQTSSLPALTTGPRNSHIRIQIRLPHSPPELLFTT